ncbi:hypothetical protein PIB30_058211 [Stylosanthes scabra]|uniref:Uncharacterized protein n=1 Tax=Stylosanthes scabra TaxID=79078 RepID=A0ABU6QJC5_9FABA|nr:hypothetical protein [Stylosanthes scabra]
MSGGLPLPIYCCGKIDLGFFNWHGGDARVGEFRTLHQMATDVYLSRLNCPLEKITQHLQEDQERAATEGIPSKVLAHPNDAIGKFYGPEKRVHGFCSVVCPVDFGKSKRIFEVASYESSSNVLQQHVEDLERQLKQAKDHEAILYRFLSQKYGDEVPTLSDNVSHT